VINSALLNDNPRITPQITIDLLTLDDDNGEFADKTPHWNAIKSAFEESNMWFVEGRTLWVDAASGNDSTGSGEQTSPFASLHVAIDSANAWGDTVLVGPGTYPETIRLDTLDNAAKEIVLKSMCGPLQTRISGGSSDTVMIVLGKGQTHATAIEGFHFEGRALGILCNGGGGPVIRRNIFSSQEGAAIYVNNGEDHISNFPVIENNTIVNSGGHGIYLLAGGPSVVRNNIIASNETSGIFLSEVGALPPTLRYNSLYANGVNYYGGIIDTATDIYTDPKLAADSASLTAESP
jgi:parallel beta-helix repeat protein